MSSGYSGIESAGGSIIECIGVGGKGRETSKGEGKREREGEGKRDRERERRSPILPWILMVQDIAFASIYPRMAPLYRYTYY